MHTNSQLRKVPIKKKRTLGCLVRMSRTLVVNPCWDQKIVYCAIQRNRGKQLMRIFGVFKQQRLLSLIYIILDVTTSSYIMNIHEQYGNQQQHSKSIDFSKFLDNAVLINIGIIEYRMYNSYIIIISNDCFSENNVEARCSLLKL